MAWIQSSGFLEFLEVRKKTQAKEILREDGCAESDLYATRIYDGGDDERVDRAGAMRLNELAPLPCELEYFWPVADPGLHPLLHGDDDGVGFVVGAVLGALLGGP